MFRFLVPSLLILGTACSSAFAIQEKFDADEYLAGTWKIDYPATRELWDTPALKEYADQLSMVPIAPTSLSFSASGISFVDTGLEKPMKVNSYNSKKKRLSVAIKSLEEFRPLEITIVDDNQLIVDQSFSVLGPLRIAYSRSKRVENGDDAKAKGPLARVAGLWHLDQEATEKMWKALIGEKVLKPFMSGTKLSHKDARTLNFTDSEVEFADGSFSDILLINSDEKQLLLFSGGRPNFQIQILADDILQVASQQRRLFAIFKRTPETPFDFNEFPKNETGDEITESFREIAKRPRPEGLNGVIARSNSVEIDELEVQRRQASYSAVGADLTNTRLQLYVALPQRNYGWDQGRLVKFNRLDDIVDDHGKQLLTPERRNNLRYLNQPTMSRMSMSRRNGTTGPGFEFTFDAPSLGATKIQKISGEIELTQVHEKTIRFSDLGLKPRELGHALLDDLKLNVEVKAGQSPEVVLQGSPGIFERIGSWHIADEDGNRIRPIGHEMSVKKRGQGFDQPIPVPFSIVMQVLDVQTSESFPFEFRDIPLK